MAIKRQKKKSADADNKSSRRKKSSSVKETAANNSNKRLKVLAESILPSEMRKKASRSLLSKLKEHLD